MKEVIRQKIALYKSNNNKYIEKIDRMKKKSFYLNLVEVYKVFDKDKKKIFEENNNESIERAKIKYILNKFISRKKEIKEKICVYFKTIQKIITQLFYIKINIIHMQELYKKIVMIDNPLFKIMHQDYIDKKKQLFKLYNDFLEMFHKQLFQNYAYYHNNSNTMLKQITYCSEYLYKEQYIPILKMKYFKA